MAIRHWAYAVRRPRACPTDCPFPRPPRSARMAPHSADPRSREWFFSRINRLGVGIVSLSPPIHSVADARLWWPRRPLATLDRKPRQGRKAATVSVDAGAEVSRRGHRHFHALHENPKDLLFTLPSRRRFIRISRGDGTKFVVMEGSASRGPRRCISDPRGFAAPPYQPFCSRTSTPGFCRRAFRPELLPANPMIRNASGLKPLLRERSHRIRS